jgi:hypothetical protein
MGKSFAAAAASLMRDSKVPRKERRNGSLKVGKARLFAGFEGEGGNGRGPVVAVTKEEVVVRVVWGWSVLTVKVLDPWTMHIRVVLEEHTVGGFGVEPEGAAETLDPLEGVVPVWAAVIVKVVDLAGVAL